MTPGDQTHSENQTSQTGTKKIPKRMRIINEKREVAKLFNSVCFVCGRRYGKGFAFHHLFYVEGEKTFSDFGDTYNYHEYVLPIIRDRIKGFLLVCKTHHHLIEWICKFGEKNRNNLYRAVSLTKT